MFLKRSWWMPKSLQHSKWTILFFFLSIVYAQSNAIFAFKQLAALFTFQFWFLQVSLFMSVEMLYSVKYLATFRTRIQLHFRIKFWSQIYTHKYLLLPQLWIRNMQLRPSRSYLKLQKNIDPILSHLGRWVGECLLDSFDSTHFLLWVKKLNSPDLTSTLLWLFNEPPFANVLGHSSQENALPPYWFDYVG